MVSNSKLMKIMLLSTLFGAAGATPALAELAHCLHLSCSRMGRLAVQSRMKWGPLQVLP